MDDAKLLDEDIHRNDVNGNDDIQIQNDVNIKSRCMIFFGSMIKT